MRRRHVRALWQVFLTNRDRVAHKWTHYFPIYERHFSRFKDTSCLVLEIGCEKGGSLQLWKKYFGPLADVVGIDIDPSCKQIEEDQIRVWIGDQSDRRFLEGVVEEIGSRTWSSTTAATSCGTSGVPFDFLYPKLSKNGVYLVEDMHTADRTYGGDTGNRTASSKSPSR